MSLRARATGFVFRDEPFTEQPLLQLDAGDNDRRHQRREDGADAGAERQPDVGGETGGGDEGAAGASSSLELFSPLSAERARPRVSVSHP